MAANAATLNWTIVDVAASQAVPAARTYASLISYGANLYLFGGYGESKGRFNDVYEFNTLARCWRLVPNLGDVPKPVYLHSAVQSGQNMLVFGGNSGKESNELYAYDIITTAWTKWASGPTFHSSAYPAPRYGHASCVYGQNGSQLLIVGGCKSNNTYYKDAFSMDLATRKWRKLEDLPLDLAYHSLLTWQDRAYLFGGFNGKSYVQHIYVLDGMTGKWNVVACTGQAPPPMCGAATVVKGNELFVFGGYTEHGHTNELYRFNFQTRVWTQLPTSNKPLARAYLQAAVVGDVCSIFGGYDGHTCISDFRCIVLPRDQQIIQPLQQQSAFAAGSGSGSSGAGYNPFLAPDLLNLSVSAQVDSLLMTYAPSGYSGAADSLNRQQLQQMLIHLGAALRSRPAGSAASAAPSGSSHPFSTAALDGVVDLGFPRERVLAVMSRMHAAGQNTANANLVVDMCIKDSADSEAAAANADSLPPQSSSNGGGLDRQNSERAALKKKMTELQAQADEAQTCKICFDETINCALRECGHLAVCTTCADSLIKNSKPCPICQKPIKGKLKIFWS